MKAEMKGQRGFTLIELMVTVAIVAILASIAIPSYSSYVTRGKITEAISKLSEGRVRLEQWFQDNRSYLNPAGGANVLGCTVAGDAITQFTDAKYFTYSCTILTQNTYVLTATGDAGQGMDGFSYTVSETNAKTSTITAPATNKGWATPNPNNCWTSKKGGSC